MTRRFQSSGRVWLAGFAVWMIAACAGAGEAATGDVERLQRQVDCLTESLAVARAELDALRAKVDRDEFVAAGDGVSRDDTAGVTEEFGVLDVNEGLGMAVIDAGRQHGLRPGMQLAATRGGRLVARLRLVDVRAGIAGAVVHRAGRDFPEKGDRVVLVAAAKE